VGRVIISLLYIVRCIWLSSHA